MITELEQCKACSLAKFSENRVMRRSCNEVTYAAFREMKVPIKPLETKKQKYEKSKIACRAKPKQSQITKPISIFPSKTLQFARNFDRVNSHTSVVWTSPKEQKFINPREAAPFVCRPFRGRFSRDFNCIRSRANERWQFANRAVTRARDTLFFFRPSRNFERKFNGTSIVKGLNEIA